MIFLNDYWLENTTVSDLTPDELLAYWDLWTVKWLPNHQQEHSGDCTNVPGPCLRCHLDSIFEATDKILTMLGQEKNNKVIHVDRESSRKT